MLFDGIASSALWPPRNGRRRLSLRAERSNLMPTGALDDLLRRQHANLIAVGELDLDCRVVDPEQLLKLLREAAEGCVAGMAARHHQMAGQRRLGRAHPPD